MNLTSILKALQERCASEADGEAEFALYSIDGSSKDSEFNRGYRRAAEACAVKIRDLHCEAWFRAHEIMSPQESTGPEEFEDECKRLRAALFFYANTQNWTSEVEGRRVVLHRIPKHESSMDRDQGAIARAALEDQTHIACILADPTSSETLTWCGRRPTNSELTLGAPRIEGAIKNCRLCIATMCRPWLRHAQSRKETG